MTCCLDFPGWTLFCVVDIQKAQTLYHEEAVVVDQQARYESAPMQELTLLTIGYVIELEVKLSVLGKIWAKQMILEETWSEKAIQTANHLMMNACLLDDHNS
jgi:hypothetical protein